MPFIASMPPLLNSDESLNIFKLAASWQSEAGRERHSRLKSIKCEGTNEEVNDEEKMKRRRRGRGCIAITLAKNRSRAKSSYPGWKKFDREIWSWNCNRQRDKAWLLFENHICIEAEYGHNYIRNGSIILVKYILAPCRCRLSWSDDIEVTDFHRLII